MINKPIVSFDFDGTLFYHKELQYFAQKLIGEGFEVCITTRRSNDPKLDLSAAQWPHTEVEELAAELGIRTINYLHGQYKNTFFKDKENYIHIDDDDVELRMIGFDKMHGDNDVLCFSTSEIKKFKDHINEFSTQRPKEL